MSPQHIVALAARLFALWLGIAALNILLSVMEPRAPGWAFLLPLAYLIPALLLWHYPLALAGKLIPRTQHDDVIRLPARQVAALATAVLGLWVLVGALPSGLRALFALFAAPQYLPMSHMLQTLVAPMAQFGIGIYLLTKPWTVADRVLANPAQP